MNETPPHGPREGGDISISAQRRYRDFQLFTALAAAWMPVAASVAGTQDDAVNERPPASAEQRERHWGVDCAALRRAVLAGAADAAAHAADWIGDLRLCAAIYNVPGDARAMGCPDYAAALHALTTGGPSVPADLRKALACAT